MCFHISLRASEEVSKMATFHLRRCTLCYFSRNKLRKSMKMVRNQLNMTTKHCSVKNLGQLGFRLQLKNQNLTKNRGTITTFTRTQTIGGKPRTILTEKPSILLYRTSLQDFFTRLLYKTSSQDFFYKTSLKDLCCPSMKGRYLESEQSLWQILFNHHG